MPKTRDPNLPQHDFDQGHYGQLPFTSLPSGSLHGQSFTFVSTSSVKDWRVDFPVQIQEDSVTEGRVYILDFQGSGVDVSVAAGKATINVSSGSGGGGGGVSGSYGSLNFMIGDGVNLITTGDKGFIRWPFNGYLTQWSLMSAVSGTIGVDIYKDTWSNFPPNSADQINAEGDVSLGDQRNFSTTFLTGWGNTHFADGDVYRFWVNEDPSLAPENVTRVTLELKYRRTT
jgi:hypothetical protein